MKLAIPLIISSLLSPFAAAYTEITEKSSKSGSSEDGGASERTLTLTVVNEAFQQPFSPFFVMVHNSDAEPLYRRGQASSSALATLAENGDPNALVSYYSGADGVLSAVKVGGPTFGGHTLEIEVTTTDECPLVTIASMAINTNDCFVALNGVHLMSGMVLDEPGLDAGSEENNESCSSILGAACPRLARGPNSADGNGEGFVHVHRGVMGVGDLSLDFDWRNPMMRVSVM